MVLVLSSLFAEADDLRRAGLAGDIKTYEFDAGRRSGSVNDGPHRVHDQVALISWDTKVLHHLMLEYVRRTRGEYWRVLYWIETDGADCSHLFQKMRNVHVAFHSNRGMRAQKCHRRQHVFALTER